MRVFIEQQQHTSFSCDKDILKEIKGDVKNQAKKLLRIVRTKRAE